MLSRSSITIEHYVNKLPFVAPEMVQSVSKMVMGSIYTLYIDTFINQQTSQ